MKKKYSIYIALLCVVSIFISSCDDDVIKSISKKPAKKPVSDTIEYSPITSSVTGDESSEALTAEDIEILSNDFLQPLSVKTDDAVKDVREKRSMPWAKEEKELEKWKKVLNEREVYFKNNFVVMKKEVEDKVEEARQRLLSAKTEQEKDIVREEIKKLEVDLSDKNKLYDEQLSALKSLRRKVSDMTFDLGSVQVNTELKERQDLSIKQLNRNIREFNVQLYKGVIRLFDEVIKFNSRHTLSYTYRGKAKLELFRNDKNSYSFENILQDFNEAIAINDNTSAPYFYRGLLYVTVRDAEKALVDFDEAIKISPNEQYYFMRAYVKGILGMVQESSEDMRKALGKKPNDKIVSSDVVSFLNRLYNSAFMRLYPFNSAQDLFTKMSKLLSHPVLKRAELKAELK